MGLQLPFPQLVSLPDLWTIKVRRSPFSHYFQGGSWIHPRNVQDLLSVTCFFNLFFPCTQQYSVLNRYQLHMIVFIQDVFDAHDFFPMICTCNISHSLCLIYSTSPQPDRDGDVSTSTLTWGTNVAHATFSQVDEAQGTLENHEGRFSGTLGIIKGGLLTCKIQTEGTLYIYIYIHESHEDGSMEGWKDADDSEGGCYVNFSKESSICEDSEELHSRSCTPTIPSLLVSILQMQNQSI